MQQLGIEVHKAGTMGAVASCLLDASCVHLLRCGVLGGLTGCLLCASVVFLAWVTCQVLVTLWPPWPAVTACTSRACSALCHNMTPSVQQSGVNSSESHGKL
jgi:hypothetical protein